MHHDPLAPLPLLTRRMFTASALGAAIAGPVAAGEPPVPDAGASDPVSQGWMQGVPPAPDRRIAFEDGSFMRFPQRRWSFSNWRFFVRTIAVGRGDGPTRPLPLALRDDIDAIGFVPLGGESAMTWRDALAATYADAILILHRGRIVQERTFGVTSRATAHILFSVTKSFVGLIAEILIAEGRLDPERRVSAYVPELAASGFADASLRQVMDMTTAIAFEEDYASPSSGIAAYAAAGKIAPRPADYQGPEGVYAFAASVAGNGRHGAAFTYRTINTEVLAWVIARIEGKPFDQVLSDRIWSRLGMEADAAIAIDGLGAPVAGGGLMARLRDVARFAEAMRRTGMVAARQAFPAAAVRAILADGVGAALPAAVYPTLAGARYRSQWWVTHNAHGAYMARGVYGQSIYIDPAAETVIVRFASHPIAGNVANDPITLPAFAAVAATLSGSRRT